MNAKAQPMSEVFKDITNPDDFSYAIRDFVDRFNETPLASLIEEEPPFLADQIGDNIADAWLAATAVYLCQKHGIKTPKWTHNNARALKDPWFAAETQAMRAILLQDSPAPFRVRNLFVSGNVLSRA